MQRYVTMSVVFVSLVVLSCAHDRSTSTPQGSGARVSEPMDDQYEVPPARDTTPKVMQAKLAHAQAVLEGLALGNCAQIESNALDLKRISEGSNWLVQDSLAYFEFSEKFRRVCDDLTNHARAKDLEAATGDYANLTHCCVACHSYLRAERQSKDLPGRISMFMQR